MQPQFSNFKPTVVSALQECACACKWERFTIWVIHPLSNAESAWYEPLAACGVWTSLEVSDRIVRLSSWQQDQSLHHAEQGKHATRVSEWLFFSRPERILTKWRWCLAAYKKLPTQSTSLFLFPSHSVQVTKCCKVMCADTRNSHDLTCKHPPRPACVQKPVNETSFFM